jgi:uncharacterized membrane protein SpoIIM required for sporulation
MATQSSKFIEERGEYWERLRNIILKIRKGGYRRLSLEEFQDFPNLYRKTCTDSETAKTLKLQPDTVEYINLLVLQAHNILYATPKKTLARFLRFFFHDFPHALAKNFFPIAVVLVLFFGAGSIAFFAVYVNPENARALLPEYTLESIKHAYADAPLRSAPDNILMAGFYISNNVTIAFASFILGVTFGLLTLFIVFYNAVTIGGILGLIVSSGYGENLGSFIIAHSVFELLGLCIAGGAGLAVGLSMIKATQEKRSLAVAAKAHEVVPLFIVAGIFIVIAALIEGFISASPVPVFIKILIAVVSLLFIIFYSNIVFIKRLVPAIKKKRHTGRTKRFGQQTTL